MLLPLALPFFLCFLLHLYWKSLTTHDTQPHSNQTQTHTHSQANEVERNLHEKIRNSPYNISPELLEPTELFALVPLIFSFVSSNAHWQTQRQRKKTGHRTLVPLYIYLVYLSVCVLVSTTMENTVHSTAKIKSTSFPCKNATFECTMLLNRTNTHTHAQHQWF